MSLSERVQPEIKINLFGAFAIERTGQPVGPLRSRKGQWVLALLLLRNGQEASRDWLAGTLWPENEESQSLAYLRREIYLLKQVLGDIGDRIQSPTTRALRFDLAGIDVD